VAVFAFRRRETFVFLLYEQAVSNPFVF